MLLQLLNINLSITLLTMIVKDMKWNGRQDYFDDKVPHNLEF